MKPKIFIVNFIYEKVFYNEDILVNSVTNLHPGSLFTISRS